jgi:hypothetical protein
MSYRIQYTRLDGILSAMVRGKSTQAAAGCIARDIAAQAARESAASVLIDLRWLEDRTGLHAHLSLPRLRVAVLDAGEDAPYDVFRERDELRCFGSFNAAVRWLRADGKAPAPAATLLRMPLAAYGG